MLWQMCQIDLNYIRPTLERISTPVYFSRVAQAMCIRLHRICALGCTGYVHWVTQAMCCGMPSLSCVLTSNMPKIELYVCLMQMTLCLIKYNLV